MKTIKQCVAEGIAKKGKLATTEGIPCFQIHGAFFARPCISGASRLRHELKAEYKAEMTREIAKGQRAKYYTPYEYRKGRYFFHKVFVTWIKYRYGKK